MLQESLSKMNQLSLLMKRSFSSDPELAEIRQLNCATVGTDRMKEPTTMYCLWLIFNPFP